MEVALYTLGGLLGLGYYLNKDEKEERLEPYVHPKIEENEKPVGENIYQQNQFEKVEGENGIMHKLAGDRFKKSLDTAKTLIVPYYFNTIGSITSGQTENPNFDPEAIYSNVDLTLLQKQLDGKFGGSKKLIPDLLTNVQPSDKVFDEQLKVSDYDEAFPSQLAGASIDGFIHNNMVPFIGRKMTQNMQLEDRHDGKLEAFTGQMKLKPKMKTEVERNKLFRSEKDLGYVFGSPDVRQLDRYVPSQLGKKNNDTPMEKIHVGRGLNNGYTAEPSGGFHSKIRINPKTSENMYVNPRESKEGRTVKGKAWVDKPTQIGVVIKKLPDNTTENVNGERNFRTTGAYLKEEARPKKIVLKPQSRGEKEDFIPGPGAPTTRITQLPDRFREKVSNVFKNTREGIPYTNYVKEGKRVNDYGRSGYIVGANERQTTGSRTEIISRAPVVGATTSRYVGGTNGGNGISSTTKSGVEGYANISQTNNYIGAKPGEGLPRNTIREETGRTDYIGTGKVNSGYNKPKIYATDENPNKATLRETLGRTNYKGTAKTADGTTKHLIYATDQNPNKTTMRETTGKTNYKGTAMVSDGTTNHKIYN